MVKLLGINSKIVMGPPVSLHQLQSLDKIDSILYIVQVQESSPFVSPPQTLPKDLQ
jgi:hypothetical protein